MLTEHFMLHPQVTRFGGGVPVEVACRCGGCPDRPIIFGHGGSLQECADDLIAKFARHSAVTP
jgi:hypothetical protein